MLAFLEIEPWEKDYILERLPGIEIKFFTETIDKVSDDLSSVEILSPFIYSKINSNVIEKLPNLKLIATRSTGYDHIDLVECEKQQIVVSNVPTYGENTVAEHTLALLISLSRKIPESIERTKKRNFSPVGLRGFDLKEKTIGIIGTGHIGQHVARIAYGLEMNILAFDPKPDDNIVKKYNVKYVTLEEMYRESDIITLHVPLNDKTKHLINDEAIGQMKKDVIILNTARGGIIDTPALLKGLESGKIAGAGLDVLEEECVVREEKELLSKHFPKSCLLATLQNNILLDKPNVLITPHNAFNSEEALKRILDTTIDNIKAYQGGKPSNIVQ